MIVAQRKTIPELQDIIKGHKNVLVLGCGTCVAVWQEVKGKLL